MNQPNVGRYASPLDGLGDLSVTSSSNHPWYPPGIAGRSEAAGWKRPRTAGGFGRVISTSPAHVQHRLSFFYISLLEGTVVSLTIH